MSGSLARRALALEGTAVLAIAAAVRLVGIGQDAGGDELYHILAAREYLVDGTLAIHGAAPYTRGEAFTMLIAWLFRWFGESPVVARIPSLLAGSLTALVVFLWVRSMGERAGAWLAGLFVAFEPDLVKLSQWARFYTLQHLAFLVGVIAVFALLSRPPTPKRVLALGGAAAASFWLALHLQVITRIGILGLGLYAGAVGVSAFDRAMARRGRRILVPLALVAAGAAAVFAGIELGVFAEARRFGTEVDLWAAESARNWRYYHALLQDSYPTFWPLFPVLLLVCAFRQPRLALLCGSVFGTAFVVHSFVAMKHPRYISYVLPFFLVPCAIAVASVFLPTVRLVERVVATWVRGEVLSRRLSRVLIAGAVAFAIFSNPACMRTVRLLTLDPSLRQPGMEHEGLSWSRVASTLKPVADRVDVLVSTDDLSTLYYFGRLDYTLSATQLDLEKTGVEFTPDQSTSVPLVSRPESIERILRCHASGLIVARTWSLHTPWAVPSDTAEFIASHTTPVPLPAEWGVAAFEWRTEGAGASPDCPTTGTIRWVPPR